MKRFKKMLPGIVIIALAGMLIASPDSREVLFGKDLWDLTILGVALTAAVIGTFLFIWLDERDRKKGGARCCPMCGQTIQPPQISRQTTPPNNTGSGHQPT